MSAQNSTGDASYRKAVVRDFLERCNRYAEAELARYRAQLDAAGDPAAQLALQDKIVHWSAYRAFNEVAIAEIERGELDDWFDAALTPLREDT